MHSHNAVGVSTWVFGHNDHRRIANRVAALGLAGVEVLVDIDIQSPSALRAVYDAHGLQIFSMTPDNMDIAHSNPALRAKAIRYYEHLLAFAAALRCPMVTCHEFVGRVAPHDHPAPEWNRLVDSCTQLAEVADGYGVVLAFEPLHQGLVSAVHDTGTVLQLLSEVDHSALAVVVDTYHLHLEDTDPVAGILRCGSRIGLVQLSDSERRALGAGDAPLAGCLDALATISYSGPFILECTDQLSGPSLQTRTIDPVRLERTLRSSLQWLDQARSSARRPGG